MVTDGMTCRNRAPAVRGVSERGAAGRLDVHTGGEMKYLILGAITEAGQQLPGPGLEAWMAEIGAWYEKYGAAGVLADPGHQLDFPHTAKTVRAGGVTDGPYIEAKEVLAGYSLLETPGIDEAVEIAQTWPGVDRGWIVMEVRPVMAQ